MSPAGLAAACHRRPFQRRDLLPVPRKPLQLRPGEQNLHRDSAPPPAAGGLYSGAICSPPPRKALRLRSGEQNLHINSAPPPATGGFFSGAICSPLLAKPCSFVPGSKIFTAIPRRRPGSAAFSAARFAPRSPRTLALRPGEQNLHTDSAPPPATGGLFSGAICSPPLANPCSFVPGSKIFTEIPRRRLPPAAFSAARFAPRSPQSLAAPSRGAKSSHRFRAAACFRRPFQRRDLLPAPRKALRLRPGEQNLHRDSAPPPATGGLLS